VLVGVSVAEGFASGVSEGVDIGVGEGVDVGVGERVIVILDDADRVKSAVSVCLIATLVFTVVANLSSEFNGWQADVSIKR
jgi:hypothetical protein